jgi:hypothetical protein
MRIVLLAAVAILLLSFSSAASNDFEYWIPYVETHQGPNGSIGSASLYSLEPDTVLFNGEPLFIPGPVGHNLAVRAGDVIKSTQPLQVIYRYYMRDFGAYEDGRLSYAILPAHLLGTRHWIPGSPTRLVVLALNDATRISVGSVVDTLDTGEYLRLDGIQAGSLLESSAPIYVLFVSHGSRFYDNTSAHTVLPESMLGRYYISPGEHSHRYRSPSSRSGVGVTGTANETTVAVGDSVFMLDAGEARFIPTSGVTEIFADKPVGAFFKFVVEATDPWDGRRSYTYAFPLLPESRAPSGVLAAGASELTIVSFQDANTILLDDGADDSLDGTIVLNRGEARRMRPSQFPEWDGGPIRIQAASPIQVFGTNMGSWNGVSETVGGWTTLSSLSATFIPDPRFPVDRYALYSLPVVCPSAERMSDLMEGIDEEGTWTWRAFAYRAGQYVENPTLIPGEGYMLASRAPETPRLRGCLALEPVECRLDPGWNIVSAPTDSFRWGDCLISTESENWTFSDTLSNTVTSQRVWWYRDDTQDLVNNGTWEYSSPEKNWRWNDNRWGGYLVFAKEPCLLTFPTISSAWRPQMESKLITPAPVEWTISLALDGGRAPPQWTSVGAREGASVGYDRTDVEMPPPFGAGSSLAIRFPDRIWDSFIVDRQPVGLMFYEWTIIVRGSSSTGDLEWTLTAVPPSLHAYLVIPIVDRAVDLRTLSSYSFALDGREREFRIVVSSQEWPGDVVRQIGNQIRPPANPSRGPFRLSFSIGRAGEAHLDILDVLGRRVDRIWGGLYDAGSYSAVWKASGVAAGVYFARLDSPAGVSVRRLLLLK